MQLVEKGEDIMIVTYETDGPIELTEEQIKRLDEASKASIKYDLDCPPLTSLQLKHMKRASEINHEKRKRVTITLRLPKSTVDKAKSLGKGYTSVLARILEATLNDNETLEKYL